MFLKVQIRFDKFDLCSLSFESRAPLELTHISHLQISFNAIFSGLPTKNKFNGVYRGGGGIRGQVPTITKFYTSLKTLIWDFIDSCTVPYYFHAVYCIINQYNNIDSCTILFPCSLLYY